ncbi:hypothetical protein QBC43DRAFT_228940 [Cladorrhinum sp. PSN259]|nr:hypothetical protein QBC43DRAFT_228940 [Cladorrhinum sp. PSN259]
MNVNLPVGNNPDLTKLVSSAIPKDRRNKTNVAILSDNWTGTGMNHNDPSFQSGSSPGTPPKLYITADSPTFDTQTLADWAAEGFDVTYLPLGDDSESYKETLRSLHRTKTTSTHKIGPGEKTFGIIAFGEAASLCLEHYHVLDNNNHGFNKLGVLVGYYPSRIPDPATRFPSSVKEVLVHLSVGEIGVVKQSQMVGIQGRKRVSKSRVDQGIGLGGMIMRGWGYKGYAYEAEAGFAERDLDELYDGICAGLAWSRSLAAMKRALRPTDGEGESLAEINAHGKFYAQNVQQIMSSYTTASDDSDPPHVTYVPTLTGATGTAALEEFYSSRFVNSNPSSLQLTLLSRTVGVDRVVDEMYVTFKHTQEMPWILPGVLPTNKRVEIVLVSIVTLKGGKLHHEHVYWDQASVLVQVGLLDPKLLPQAAKDSGVERLPVVGKKAARRVFACGSEEEEADNQLIHVSEEDLEDQKGGEDENGTNEDDEEKKTVEQLDNASK